MTSERWNQIEQLFDATLAVPELDRSRFLDEACANDPDLRAEVASLIASSLDATRDLRGVVERGARRVAMDATSARLGDRIGAYRLETLLGEGGMGAVYLASRDDAEYDQRVAIKILRQGLPSSDAVARFRDERQILAALEHPGIVRLLDGGSTDDGLPYLVMEHIDGMQLVEYARAHQLSIRARLELFGPVCAAVAYAHQQLVVHRDLKPSNILVTADGTPKLLDFGIAKLLDGGGGRAATRTGMAAFTPEYASPEQVRGETVSTASDVYSLGAVLYELLTEAPLYGPNRSALELVGLVRDVVPQRPSLVAPPPLRRALAGDLDNIVLKALQKDPAQRYRSVDQLADDISRHLAGLPVTSRAATRAYRARKFVGRHRGALSVAVLVTTALALLLVSSIRQAHRADAEAAVAQRRFFEVRQLATSLIVELDDKVRGLHGSTESREWIVQRALALLDGLASETAGDPGVDRELARAYMRNGDIQGNGFEPNLGRARDGIQSYEKARAILARLSAAGVDDEETRELQIASDYGLGFLLYSAGDLEPSRAYLRTALTAALRPTPANRLLSMRGCSGLVQLESWLGDLGAAHREATACVEAARQWNVAQPGAEPTYWIGIMLNIRGGVATRRAEPEAGLMDSRVALATLEALAAQYPEDPRFEREVAYTMARIAEPAAGIGDSDLWVPNLGDSATAERMLARASEMSARIATRDPNDLRAALDHASFRGNFATALSDRDPAGSIPVFAEVNAIFDAMPRATRDEYNSRQIEWLPRCAMSLALAKLGRRTEALEQAALGLAIVESTGPDAARLDDFRVVCVYQVARAHHVLGDDAVAGAQLDQLAVDLAARGRAHPTITNVIGYVATLSLRAELGGPGACADRTHALATWRAWPGESTAFVRRRDAELARAAAGCP